MSVRIEPEKTAWVLTEYVGHESGEVFTRGIFKTFDQLNRHVGDPTATESEWLAQLFIGPDLRQQKYMQWDEWADQIVER